MKQTKEQEKPRYLGNPAVYRKIFVDFVIALLGIGFLIFLLPKGLTFFLPFVIGWIIAWIANPLVRFLEKHIKIVRKHGSVLVICAAIALVVALLYFGGMFIGRQVIDLIKSLPRMYDVLQQMFMENEERLAGVFRYIPADFREAIDKIQDNLLGWLGDFVGHISSVSFGSAGSMVKNVAEGFLIAIFSILSAYFFVSDKEKLSEGYHKYIPKGIQRQLGIVKENFVKALGGYFKAQLKIMAVIIIILFAGFELLQVDYSFWLAFGVAILDFLPFFGTGTVLFPWAFFDVIGGNYFRAACLMLIYLVCQVVRQILQPKMVGDSIGLSPMATLFFMFVGYRLRGVWGMIIAIPIGMAIINLYRSGVFDSWIRGARIVIHDINEYRKY